MEAGAFIPGNPRTLASKTEPTVSVWQTIIRFRDESFVLVSMLLALSNQVTDIYYIEIKGRSVEKYF